MSASTQVAALDPQSLQAQATILQKCTAAVARELSQLLAALKYLVKEGWKFKHIINLIAKHDDRIFNNQLFDHEVKYMVNPADGEERLIYDDIECLAGWNVVTRNVNLIDRLGDTWATYWAVIKKLSDDANIGHSAWMMDLDGFLAGKAIKGFKKGNRAWFSIGCVIFVTAASIAMDGFIMQRIEDHNVYITAQLFTNVSLVIGAWQVIRSEGLSGWTATLWLFEWTILRLPSQLALFLTTFANGLQYGGVGYYLLSILGRLGLTAIRTFAEPVQRYLIDAKLALVRLKSGEEAQGALAEVQEQGDVLGKQLCAIVRWIGDAKDATTKLSVGTDRDTSAGTDRWDYWGKHADQHVPNEPLQEADDGRSTDAAVKAAKKVDLEIAGGFALIWMTLSVRSETLIPAAVAGIVLLLFDAYRDYNRPRISQATMKNKIDVRGNAIVVNLAPVGLQLWISGAECFDSIDRIIATVVVTTVVFCCLGDVTGKAVNKLLAPMRGLISLMNWIIQLIGKGWSALAKLFKDKADDDQPVLMQDVNAIVTQVVEGEAEPSRIEELVDQSGEGVLLEEASAGNWPADFVLSTDGDQVRFDRPIRNLVNVAGMRLRIVPRPF